MRKNEILVFEKRKEGILRKKSLTAKLQKSQMKCLKSVRNDSCGFTYVLAFSV